MNSRFTWKKLQFYFIEYFWRKMKYLNFFFHFSVTLSKSLASKSDGGIRQDFTLKT